MTTVRDLLAQTELPRRESELLLLSLLGCDRSWIFAHGDAPVAARSEQAFVEHATRRQAGEPLAYILGEREFWSLPLKVTPEVLIPRPDTEVLVQWAAVLLNRTPKGGCLDLGTGSGAVALALKMEFPGCSMTAVDCSDRALSVARENGQRLGLEVEWLLGSWFEPVEERRFDLIVSNPPYVRDDDEHLAMGDLPAEPQLALLGGPDGLDCIRCLIAEGQRALAPGGGLLIEHGWDQGPAVRELMHQSAWQSIETRRDLAGHERVTYGCRH